MDITFDREMRKKVQDIKKLNDEMTSLLYSAEEVSNKELWALLDEKSEQLGIISVGLALELYDHIGEEEE